MGWASGGGIFDPVAQALIDLNAPEDIKRKVLTVLLRNLLDSDWDTTDESLYEFRHDPVIISIFYEQGCGGEVSYEHHSRIEADPTTWALVCGKCGRLRQRPLTIEGHDDLIRLWASHEKDIHDGDGEVLEWMLLGRPSDDVEVGD